MSIDSIVGAGREFASSGNATWIIPPVARNRSIFVREQDICSHGRRVHDCRKCKGRGICRHNHRRRQCALCGNTVERHCPHGRIRYDCIDCKGGGICSHRRRRRRCKECRSRSDKMKLATEKHANTRSRAPKGTKRRRSSIKVHKGSSTAPIASTVTNKSRSLDPPTTSTDVCHFAARLLTFIQLNDHILCLMHLVVVLF